MDGLWHGSNFLLSAPRNLKRSPWTPADHTRREGRRRPPPHRERMLADPDRPERLGVRNQHFSANSGPETQLPLRPRPAGLGSRLRRAALLGLVLATSL